MRRFICRPQSILAANDNEDTRVADISSIMKDDFNFALDGFDKLNREGQTNKALEIMNTLHADIQAAIAASSDAIADINTQED